jgi:hypothetical protein
MGAVSAGHMACDSGVGWPQAEFQGPAAVGLAGLFGSLDPECSCHLQSATALTGCHLWQVDSSELLGTLQKKHPRALAELAQLLVQVRGHAQP